MIYPSPSAGRNLSSSNFLTRANFIYINMNIITDHELSSQVSPLTLPVSERIIGGERGEARTINVPLSEIIVSFHVTLFVLRSVRSRVFYYAIIRSRHSTRE